MVRTNNKMIRKQQPLPQRVPYNNLPIGITIKELRLAQELAKTPDDKMGALKRANLYPRANNRKMRRVPTPEQTFKELTYSTGFKIAFQKAQVDRVNRTQVTEDSLISHLHKVANLDPLDTLDEYGAIRPVKEMSLDTRLCISEITSKKIFKKSLDGKGFDVDHIESNVKFGNRMAAHKELMAFKFKAPLPDVNNTYIGNQYNGNINNEQKTLNLSKLTEKELDLLSKAFGIETDQTVIDMCEIENQGVVNE